MRLRTLFLPYGLVLMAGLLPPRAWAAPPVLPRILTEVGFDQRLNERVPGDLEFLDEEGRRVALADYFDGKPVVLTLAYYRCPMLCTQVLNGVAHGLRQIPFTIGEDYRVLTVSFDPSDTPPMAAAKRRNYLRYLGAPADSDGWHFLTGSEESIARLTDAVGFRYRYDPRSEQFAHAAGVIVLTPDGTISRYFYDLQYSERDLRLGLVEASENRIGSPVDQVLLFCFHYDPAAGRYGAAIMNFVRAVGVATVLGIGIAFHYLRKGERSRRLTGERPPQSP